MRFVNLQTTSERVGKGQVRQLLLRRPIASQSATLPVLAFGDADTGLFQSADDVLEFSTAGVSRFKIIADGTVAVAGNLVVSGTTTTVDTTTLTVDDKNIELGNVATPTDITADGGGITLKGATDKTFNWVNSTDAWTSSEHINLASGKTFQLNGAAITSSAAELNLFDGVTSTTAELNLLDGVTSTTAELNILDGVTSTAAELNILDGVTSTAAELNILDGVTSTAAELNLLNAVSGLVQADFTKLAAITSDATELNLLDGVSGLIQADFTKLAAITSDATELNILDGATSTAAELNILDGATVTTTEINLIDGGTARGTTALASGDGILINDGGTMAMTNVDTVRTYMQSGLSTDAISDADNDTKIQMEESADEDKIRFDTGGTERMVVESTGVRVQGAFGAGPAEPQIYAYNTSGPAEISLRGGGDTWSLNTNYSANRLDILQGDGASGTIKMTFLPSGNVGIGSTSPSDKLYVSGGISATGDVTSSASDERLKENKVPITSAIKKITQLKGITYDWVDNISEVVGSEWNPDKKRVGLIAQDVQKVLPEVVSLAPFDRDMEGKSRSGKDYLTVDYASMVPLLIEAIKEQQKQIDKLKSELKSHDHGL